MINLIGKLLSACAGFSWWWEDSTASFIFFGEIPYPTNESEDK